MRMPTDIQANAPVFDIDQVFGKMAVAMGKAAWTIPELTQREKCFACLAADVCTRDLDLPFQMHVQMAIANDVPIGDIHEAIVQSAIEGGHTGALMALRSFKILCADISQPLPQDEDASSSNGSEFNYFQNSSGNMDVAFLNMWKPLMPTYWSRAGLSLKERVFISLTGNVLQGVLGSAFAHHLDLARAAGAEENQVRALFRFLSEYGFSRSWTALEAFNKVWRNLEPE